jgi:hypothetical protein
MEVADVTDVHPLLIRQAHVPHTGMTAYGLSHNHIGEDLIAPSADDETDAATRDIRQRRVKRIQDSTSFIIRPILAHDVLLAKRDESSGSLGQPLTSIDRIIVLRWNRPMAISVLNFEWPYRRTPSVELRDFERRCGVRVSKSRE